VLAMQYSIQLPVNYDVEKIRDRVHMRSKLFDAHAGLVHKSFLYNEKDRIYAPFYIWKDVIEAQKFLLDDLFKGVIAAFDRCRVRSWFVVHTVYGDRTIQPAYALREIDVIAPEEKLDNFLRQEQEAQKELLANPNLYMQMVAIDADRWEILRFSLWRDKESAPRSFSDAFISYDVLHVSEPKGSIAQAS